MAYAYCFRSVERTRRRNSVRRTLKRDAYRRAQRFGVMDAVPAARRGADP